MNDPFELGGLRLTANRCKVVPPQLHTHVSNLFHTEVLPQIQAQVGAVCLSTSWNNPVLWAHYADKHAGIALGFDIDESETIELSPARYVAEKQEHDISELLDEAYGALLQGRPMEWATHLAVFRNLLGTKFSDWAYEEEVRLFAKLEQEIDGKFFVNFDDRIVLIEVILGMRCPVETGELLPDFATYTTPIRIMQAMPSPDHFRVLECETESVTYTPPAPHAQHG
jgi:hypothetical protein